MCPRLRARDAVGGVRVVGDANNAGIAGDLGQSVASSCQATCRDRLERVR